MIIDDTNNPSGEPGSGGDTNTVPDSGQAVDLTQYVAKEVYDELESRLGSQGNELGELRTYINDIAPLMEALEKNPTVIKAIMDGKIDEGMASAVLEGKLTINEAKEVTAAANQIKEDMSQTTNLTPEQIEAVVAAQVSKALESTLGSKIDEVKSDIENFKVSTQMEKAVDEFIATTPDIGEYADEIQKYLDDNAAWVEKLGPQAVEVAYSIVKGKTLSAEKQAEMEAEANEAAKAAASVGGNGSAGNIMSEPADAFGKTVNPNLWGR